MGKFQTNTWTPQVGIPSQTHSRGEIKTNIKYNLKEKNPGAQANDLSMQ